MGGKRWLIDRGIIVPRLGEGSRYFEPFLGAGSMFFAIAPESAFLSDTNAELICAYRQISKSVEDVIDALETLSNDAETFRRVREASPKSNLDRAVRFLYLNRTAYAGMYRVNRAGRFNVPFGGYHDRRVCQPEILRSAASALNVASLSTVTYQSAVKAAGPGDFVYFDPPYDSRGTRELFSRYSSRIFTWPMHQRLATLATSLAERGVHVLVSNTAHPDVLKLYPRLHVQVVKRSTRLSRDPLRRGYTEEALFSSYPSVLAG
jgi:DNA adenine methylase